MLIDKLKSERYYLDKMSMFMRNSYGISDQLSIFITMLNLVDNSIDDVLRFFDITQDEVFLQIEEMGTSSDILDKIAHLYGLKRQFTLIYKDTEEHTVDVTLNNFELWLLVKAQLLQNCYNGSYGQMREYYDKMNIPVYIFTNSNSGQALIMLNTTSGITVKDVVYKFEDNPNVELLFKANLLTIRSMGIQYLTSTSSISALGVWDSLLPSRSWDNAKWGL